MAENSAISWTDSTFNPWIGCTRVSPGCDHCYAERDNARWKWVSGWGPTADRKRTKTWVAPLKWQRNHAEFFAKNGHHRRVFCASLADVFDNTAPDEWRADLWDLMRATPDLRWLLLTKRIGNAMKMLPGDFGPGLYPHVGIMATIINQEEWDRDYRKLMAIAAAWRGVSAEPLLSDIDMRPKVAAHGAIDWMITGGESGAGFRALDMSAVRSIRDQCRDLGITFHHKQNGGFRGKDAGCLVEGVEHKHFPPALAV